MDKLEEQIAKQFKKAISEIESIANSQTNESQINMKGILGILDKEILNAKHNKLYNSTPMYKAVQEFKKTQEKDMARAAELNVQGTLPILKSILDTFYVQPKF